MTGCKRFVEHFLLDRFIYPPADFYCWSASKRLQKTSSEQCKALKNIRQFHFKGSFFLPAQNLYLFLAQPNCLVHLDLSGTDCTVDSVCIQRLCHALSTHHRLIASFNMGFSRETQKRRALKMNQLPRKNNVSWAESQLCEGKTKEICRCLWIMQQLRCMKSIKHSCFTGLFTFWLLFCLNLASGCVSSIASGWKEDRCHWQGC